MNLNDLRQALRERLNALLLVDTLDVPAAQANAALNRTQMRTLPLVYISIGLFYFAFALLQVLILQEPGMGLLVAVAVVSGAFLLAVARLIRRQTFSARLAEPLAAIPALTVLVSIQLRFYLTGDPKQAANVALFVFAMAVLFFDTRWFLLMAALALAGLVHTLVLFAEPQDWRYYLVVFLAAAATGLVAHVGRLRAYRRTEALRIREYAQRQELEKRNLQLRTNMAAGRQITSILDLDTLLRQIAAMVWEKYRIYYVGVFLPAENGRSLQAAAEAGRALQAGPLNLTAGEDGHIGWVMATGESLSLDNVGEKTGGNGRYYPAEKAPNTRSELLVPLQMGEQVLGVLDLQSARPYRFTPQEIPVFQLLADQIAVALENARLYAQVKQFNQELESKVAERTQELQQTYARLARLDQTKTDFITIASHEMLTPLTIINLNAQMFLDEETILANKTYAGWVQGIDTGVARMREVVETMLDVAKLDSEALKLHLSPLALPLFIQQIANQFHKPLAARQITLTVSPMPALPPVEADAEALAKVFYHLLENGIKYTPDGGQIEVNGRSTQLHLNGSTQNGVEIVIADTGVGIAPDVQALIFEKFYQTGEVKLHSSGKTKFKGGGSGLGLAIAKGIVLAHHGQIWVESPGYDETAHPGSRFHIVLPLHQPGSNTA